jgi:PAS domain S-box-containing protein
VIKEDTIKILLVDDEERNLDALESILESSDCEFIRARSAEEALLALLNHEFAALILDIKMPGISGLELAQLIKSRKRNEHVPILFLTAQLLEERDVLHAYDVGGVDYLSKPLNPAILRSKVAVFVNLFRTNRALVREIQQREQAQEELRLAKDELERRVIERTAALAKANRDIQDSETRLSAILQNTSALVYLTDADNRFVHINRRFEELLGKTNDEVRGCSVYDVLPQETAAILDANHRHVLAERSAVEFEEVIADITRTRVYASIKAPLFDGDRPAGIVAVSTDITERKQLEDALREADRRKDEFLATLAHELRNPIAPIRYAVQVVNLKSPTTPEVRWAIEVIERQTKHMARLIDDLLDISRITRNTFELRRDRVSLTTIINAAIETSRPLLQNSGCELELTIPPDPIEVEADAVRLEQVFANLLNNASKYGRGEDGRGRIHIIVTPGDQTVRVTVADTGVGIAPSMLPRIFDMFTQVGRSIEQCEGGLGIGLSLAKRLTEMHGGTIEASSPGIGKGSKFTVTLPTMLPDIPQIRITPPPEVKRMGKRVLIADDNADVCEAFEILLRTLGHDVETAHDGIEALEKAERYRPEVIVLDIGMPNLNGREAARRIRQLPWAGNVVLIALTGWGNEKDKRESEEAGFDIHLVKPVDPLHLINLLDGLAVPKMNQELKLRKELP